MFPNNNHEKAKLLLAYSGTPLCFTSKYGSDLQGPERRGQAERELQKEHHAFGVPFSDFETRRYSQFLTGLAQQTSQLVALFHQNGSNPKSD